MSFSGEGNLVEAVISGDPNKTVVAVVCDAQGRLIVDVAGMQVITGVVMIEDTSGNSLTSTGGSLNTNVTNFPVTQAVSDTNLDKSFGVWAYYAGVSGTAIVSAGQRVLGLTAHTTSGGTIVINSGATITIPANVSFLVQPLGNLIAPTVVFTNTDSYFIEVVS